MKIILDIPDSIIPVEVRKLINSGKCTQTQHREIVRAFLTLALDEFDDCIIGVNEYKVVLTEDSRR